MIEERKILYISATEDEEKLNIPEPAGMNVYGMVLDSIIGEGGVPVGKYSTHYHMAYIQGANMWCNKLVFEGKQDDFFYNLNIYDPKITEDFEINKQKLKKLLIKSDVGFVMKWWHNNSSMTDEHGIRRVRGMLEYDIHLTDKITLRVKAKPYNNYDDGIHDMIELCSRVDDGEFELKIV